MDRTIFMPSADELKKSTNSYDLLREMMIPRLQVDNIMKTISMNGGFRVQTRINNIKASPSDLSALTAKYIVRVEYIEDPGNRYGNEELGAVINIITRRSITGGEIDFQLNNSINRIWGENVISGKYNHNKLQSGLNFNNKYSSYKHVRTDATETFKLTHKTIDRIQQGIDDKVTSIDYTSLDLFYNYIDPDKQTFSVTLRNGIRAKPNAYITSKMYTKNVADTILAKTFFKDFAYSPVLDMYYQQKLSKTSSMEFNVVGTYIRSTSHRDYKEFRGENELVNLLSDVDGNRYSIIAEGIFDKTLKHFVLSIGGRHIQGSTYNNYNGNSQATSEMSQSETNAFAEIKGKIKKLNYTAGMGVTRSWFKDANNNKEYYTLRPNLKLGYPLNEYSYLRYSFNAYPSIPSLGLLTDVEIAQDTIQIRRGNPNLKMYNTYSNNLTYSLNYKKFNLNITGSHRYSVAPIMEDIFAEDSKIVFSHDNQKSFSIASISTSLGIQGIDFGSLKQFFSIGIYATYNKYHSVGNNYNHHYDNLYYSISPTFYHKGFYGGVQWRKFPSSIFGETIYKGENSFVLYSGYRKNNFDIMLLAFEPFNNNYKTGKELLSNVAQRRSWDYIREVGQMFSIKINYQLKFGKQIKGYQKKIQNSDTENGILK